MAHQFGVKGQARVPGSGRKKGTPNRATIERIEAYQDEQRSIMERARISQLMPLEHMLNNMRYAAERIEQLHRAWNDARAGCATGTREEIDRIEMKMERILAFGQRCARDAAVFLHPQLAAIKHEHRGADGELLRPIIEITGYPQPEQPVPALPAPVTVSDNQSKH